jgi:GT2 family glycosyltransferase
MREIKNTGFPAGTVAIPSGLLPRHWEFIEALNVLEAPEGTITYRESSCDIAHNCNRCIQEMRGDWIFFLDDDQVFEPDVLMRLLARAYGCNSQIDLAMPLNIIKMPPYRPMIFHNISKLGACYRWEEIPRGLFPLPEGDMVGRAGMLIKRNVLDSIGFPWFESGQIFSGLSQEDTHFALKVQQHGYTIWIDTDQILDHLCYGVARARRDGAGLYRPEFVSTGYQYGGQDE